MRRIVCLAFVLLGFGVSHLRAHPSLPNQAIGAPTVAQLFVTDGEVRLQLEIGKPDLPVFADLITDGAREDPSVAQLRFFSRGWVIEADDQVLRGRVVTVEPRARVRRDAVTGEPLPPGGPPGDAVTFAEVRYPLAGKPDNITMKPPKAADGATATIGLVVWHRAIPVCDFDYLKLPTGFRLDWEDPWKSRFRGLRFQRYWNFPMWMNLTVEPRAVRWEVFVRPGFTPWADAPPATLLSQSSLSVNGQPVRPAVEPVRTLRQTLGRIDEAPNPGDIPPETAFRRFGFVVPVTSRPLTVTVNAGFITGAMKDVPVWVNAADKPHALTPAGHVLAWGNPSGTLDEHLLAAPPSDSEHGLPWLSMLVGVVGSLWIVPGFRPFRSNQRRLAAYLVLVVLVAILWIFENDGRASRPAPSTVPPEPEGRQLVHRLLADSYRAFDCREEEDVYDTLAETVSGPLLREAYLSIRRMLDSPGELGRARVSEVSVRDATLAPLRDGPGYAVHAVWILDVAITHLGHSHNRLTQCEGELIIRARNGRWMIESLTVTDQRPATPETPK